VVGGGARYHIGLVGPCLVIIIYSKRVSKINLFDTAVEYFITVGFQIRVGTMLSGARIFGIDPMPCRLRDTILIRSWHPIILTTINNNFMQLCSVGRREMVLQRQSVISYKQTTLQPHNIIITIYYYYYYMINASSKLIPLILSTNNTKLNLFFLFHCYRSRHTRIFITTLQKTQKNKDRFQPQSTT